MSLLARIEDRYEVVAKIKEGGMGEIYKVRHRLLDEVRVVKVLHPELVGDSELSERFAREARAAIQLRHPNIVQIFDFTLDDSGTGLIVMEYIDGTDLKQLVARPERPSIALSIEIARQGLRALGFLHRHGFVHRDVSPDNLMLSSDVERRPLVKVIDLGIAKRRGSDPQLTASGMFLGKFRYASPEHFGASGTDGIEARSDLYTFGLVLYELLTGRYPIRGETTSQLIAGHLFQPPHDFSVTDPAGRVPELLRRAVLKILAKEPAERFASADELMKELKDLQADYPLSSEVLDESRRLAVGPVAATTGGELPMEPSSVESTVQSGSVVPASAASPAAPAKADDPPAEDPVEDDPSARFEALVREVDTLLDSGRLIEADRILFQAKEAYGSTTELTTARERLDKLYQDGAETGIRTLISQASDLAGKGEQAQALEVLDKARAAASSRPALRKEVEEAARDLNRPPRRTVDDVERELVALIRDQDLNGARDLLAEAEAERSEDPAFEPLRRLLARTVEERIHDLVKQAGLAFETEDFAAATDFLRQVLELDPGNSWIRERLDKSRAALRRQQEEARQAEERAAELRTIEQSIAAGDLETAANGLQVAAARLGDHLEFTEAAERLEDRRREARVSSLIRQAERARKGKDVLKARLLIAEALELRPGDRDAESLAKTLDEEQREAEMQLSPLRTAPLSAGLMKAYTDIEGLRAKGDSLAAWRSLLGAIEEFGEIDTLVKLRRLIAEEVLDDTDKG